MSSHTLSRALVLAGTARQYMRTGKLPSCLPVSEQVEVYTWCCKNFTADLVPKVPGLEHLCVYTHIPAIRAKSTKAA